MGGITINDIKKEIYNNDGISTYYKQVLQKYSDYDIYCFFIGFDIGIKQFIQSPIRVDHLASFNIFYPSSTKPKWGGQLVFKDFNGETGDVFKFVKLWTIHNAGGLYLGSDEEIANFILEKMEGGNVVRKQAPPALDTSKEYQIKSMPFTKYHLEYWSDLGVSKELLEYYKVFACEYLLDENSYAIRKFKGTKTFAYVIFDKFKLYQPEEENFKKFFNQCPPEYMQGFEQCTHNTDTLYITKSAKDILVYQAHTEEWIDAIAPHGEGYILHKNWVKWILDYPNIVIIYDYDHTGVKGANRLRKQLKSSIYYQQNNVRVEFVSTERKFKRGKYVVALKDISDLRLVFGEAKAKQRINEMFYDWRKQGQQESKERKKGGPEGESNFQIKRVEGITS